LAHVQHQLQAGGAGDFQQQHRLSIFGVPDRSQFSLGVDGQQRVAGGERQFFEQPKRECGGLPLPKKGRSSDFHATDVCVSAVGFHVYHVQAVLRGALPAQFQREFGEQGAFFEKVEFVRTGGCECVVCAGTKEFVLLRGLCGDRQAGAGMARSIQDWHLLHGGLCEYLRKTALRIQNQF